MTRLFSSLAQTCKTLRYHAIHSPAVFDLRPWVELSRINKLAGTMLLFWPYAWALTMAARTTQLGYQGFVQLLVYGFLLAMLVRSTGCIWNDILDKDFDSQVARTKDRPIPSGQVTVHAALAFLFLHLMSIGLAHVTLMNRYPHYDNALMRILGLTLVFPLAGLYPLMKRITYWPQAWLGIAFSFGVFIAWASVTAGCPPSAYALFLAAWSWTLWYDTIYACQDVQDDTAAGVKSTALLFGSRIKLYLTVFGFAVVLSLGIAGFLNGQELWYFAISTGGAALHLTWQLWYLDVTDPRNCRDTFNRNGFAFGAIVWSGILADYVASKL